MQHSTVAKMNVLTSCSLILHVIFSLGQTSCLHRIIKQVDSIMEKFRKPVYYNPPSFHVSIASFPVHVNSEFDAIASNDNVYGTLVPIMTVPANYVASSSSCSDMIAQGTTLCNTDDEDVENSSSSGDDEGARHDYNITQNKLNLKEPLSSVLPICFIECRIGDRLFQYRLPSCEGGISSTPTLTDARQFIEIIK